MIVSYLHLIYLTYNHINVKNFVVLGLIFIFFLAGFFIGYNFENKKDDFTITRSSGNSLINPLLDCEIYEQSHSTKTNSIKYEVNKYIESNKNDYRDLSVYFRDLNNGPSFGINEKDVFSPASLLKVPLMITYLKQAETNPDILDKQIKYFGNHLLIKNLPENETLTPGSSYTINDLIFRMISLSDNIAFESLLNNIDSSVIKSIHKELNLIYPNNSTPDDYVTVKSYAGLFRILYNSTFLSRDSSIKALKYLANSDFKMGIKAGIPKNINTALKFGVRDIDENGLMQLHDCGIVYSPKKPYLICIMTKGNDSEKLTKTIKEISSIVYENL